MLLIAYRIEPRPDNPAAASPTIIDLDAFSMIELVKARDKRRTDGGGRWFGHQETPTILSKKGKQKIKKGVRLNKSSYGWKESEGKDFNEDTNFGKLKRIPHSKLQAFLAKFHLDVAVDLEPKLSEAIQEVEKTLDKLEDET